MDIPVFSPFFGFSSISAPEIAVEVDSFREGTFLYQRHVVKGAEVSPVTFERAASPFDSDFYDWITYTIEGNRNQVSSSSLSHQITGALGDRTGTQSWRRNIVVIQFTRIGIPIGEGGPLAIGIGAAFLTLASGGAAFASTGLALAGFGPFEFAPRIPGRGWLLHNCLPINYRAASDFDAASGAISLVELEVQPEFIEEFSLGFKP